jgi:hypothetical protein
MKDLTIVYQSYIPVNLITDFTQVVHPVKVEKKEVKTGAFNHFDAPDINDIIIYIDQHPTEVIVGIINNAVWAGIALLLVGISKLPLKFLHSGGKQTDRQKCISLRLSDKIRGIEVVFKGDVNEQQADTLINSLKEFLNSEKVNDAFYNSDNIPENSKKPIIRLIYNKKKKIWEPENLGDKRRKMDELRNQAQRKFRS